MVKIFAFLVKKAGLSDAQFHEHWRHPHGTLTRAVPHFVRYVQNHGIGPVPAVAGMPVGPWLGIPVIWLDVIDDLAAANAHPAYAPLDADGDALYDRARVAWLITRESVVVPSAREGEAAPVKVMLLLKLRLGASADDTADVIVQAAAGLAGLGGLSWSAPLDPAEALFDLVVELVFDNAAAFERSWTHPSRQALLDAARDRIDWVASRGFLAREERVIWPEGGAPTDLSSIREEDR